MRNDGFQDRRQGRGPGIDRDHHHRRIGAEVGRRKGEEAARTILALAVTIAVPTARRPTACQKVRLSMSRPGRRFRSWRDPALA